MCLITQQWSDLNTLKAYLRDISWPDGQLFELKTAASVRGSVSAKQIRARASSIVLSSQQESCSKRGHATRFTHSPNFKAFSRREARRINERFNIFSSIRRRGITSILLLQVKPLLFVGATLLATSNERRISCSCSSSSGSKGNQNEAEPK